MCLVEVVSGKVPWKGVCMVAEVTHKITTGA
eukprot:COSAG04_NODE_7323_length_1147_cov_1.213740_1_plen_30_part_10